MGIATSTLVSATLVAALLSAGCTGTSTPTPGAASSRPATVSSPPSRSPSATTSAPPGITVVAVGDISCAPDEGGAGQCRQAATARVTAAQHPAAVLLLGDNQYEAGSASAYRQSFDVSWGSLRALLRPSPGNHEYGTAGAAGYRAYFGSAATPHGTTWYSFDVAGWHLVSLDGNCGVVGCGQSSAQLRWLVADLRAHPSRCTLAYWHEPRFSSGLHGDDPAVDPLWQALVAAHADVVLNGHDHDYERFAPLDAAGRPAATGIREFVVGTGGRSLYPMVRADAGSQVRHSSSYGVLRLQLQPGAYSWRFVTAAGVPFSDSGSGRCS